MKKSRYVVGFTVPLTRSRICVARGDFEFRVRGLGSEGQDEVPSGPRRLASTVRAV